MITGSTIVIVGVIAGCSVVGKGRGEGTRRDGPRHHPSLNKVDTACSKFVEALVDGQHLAEGLELA
jgi:hypothetical protein